MTEYNLQPITPAQAALLPTALALHQLMVDAQPETPYQVRSYRLDEGTAHYDQGLELLAAMNIQPSAWGVNIEDAQRALDTTVTVDDARAFFAALPWQDFKFTAHNGEIHVLAPWGDFGDWMKQLGYSVPQGRLRTYPDYSMRTGDPIWEALLEAVTAAGLMEQIRELPPTYADLTDDEIAELPTSTSGVRYWRGYRVGQIEGQYRTRYTDADDRPGDDSHDGNGWTERVRRVHLAGYATPDELAEFMQPAPQTPEASSTEAPDENDEWETL